jgi:hypothetical protein
MAVSSLSMLPVSGRFTGMCVHIKVFMQPAKEQVFFNWGTHTSAVVILGLTLSAFTGKNLPFPSLVPSLVAPDDVPSNSPVITTTVLYFVSVPTYLPVR